MQHSNVISFATRAPVVAPVFATLALDPNAVPLRYEIFDRQTKGTVGTAKTKSGARLSVDRRDNAYGAYRYGWRAVYADGSVWNGF